MNNRIKQAVSDAERSDYLLATQVEVAYET
ncbi:not available [Yersinia enterocolitica]|nr:not available [Yersinia enterocolitica]UXD29260.1 not available [Yersinia enterocolitica]